MPLCSFSRDSAMFDSTPIENMFLIEYLPQAPDDCLRVYLYARMLCCHPEMGGEIADIAKALHMEEDAVLEAFSFWERQGLVERMTDRPPTYSFRSLNSGVSVRENDEVRRHLDYNFAVLKILDVTSIGSKQTRITYDWLDVLGYSQEAALRLLEYEKKASAQFSPNTIIKRADKRAVEWAERGIHTLEDVEKAIAYDDRVYSMTYTVLKQLGMARKPSVNELDCVRRWINDWKLNEQDVLEACVHTTKSRNPSIAYLDAILKEKVGGGSVHFEALKGILQELGAANAKPTPDQLSRYGDLLARGFEPEAVMIAAVQNARKNRHRFEDMESMLDKWDKMGVHTHAQAEKFVADMQQATAEMHALLEEAGVSRRPGMDDLERLKTWKQKHSMDLIHYAAKCSRGKARPVPYMEKLLSEWEKANITAVEAAKAQVRPAMEKPAVPASGYLNYQQHTYTEADFGDDFYIDPLKEKRTGGDQK